MNNLNETLSFNLPKIFSRDSLPISGLSLLMAFLSELMESFSSAAAKQSGFQKTFWLLVNCLWLDIEDLIEISPKSSSFELVYDVFFACCGHGPWDAKTPNLPHRSCALVNGFQPTGWPERPDPNNPTRMTQGDQTKPISPSDSARPTRPSRPQPARTDRPNWPNQSKATDPANATRADPPDPQHGLTDLTNSVRPTLTRKWNQKWFHKQI